MDQARGTALRMLREHAKYTQEDLARDAGCNVRSVQRAEAGEPINVDTLKAIGSVLGFDGEALLRVSAPSEEDVREAARLAKEFDVVKLTIAKGTAEWSVLAGATAHYFDCVSEDERVRDAAADLESHVRDCSDVWNDIDPRSQRECTKELAAMVADLDRLGAAVSLGMRRTRIRLADGSPFDLAILLVVVSAKEAAKQYAMIPKQAQIQLS